MSIEYRSKLNVCAKKLGTTPERLEYAINVLIGQGHLNDLLPYYSREELVEIVAKYKKDLLQEILSNFKHR